MEVQGIIHSEERNGVQYFDVFKNENGKLYAVLENGVKCSAIFNPFTCLYYADDIYGIINEEDLKQ